MLHVKKPISNVLIFWHFGTDFLTSYARIKPSLGIKNVSVRIYQRVVVLTVRGYCRLALIIALCICRTFPFRGLKIFKLIVSFFFPFFFNFVHNAAVTVAARSFNLFGLTERDVNRLSALLVEAHSWQIVLAIIEMMRFSL